MKFNLKVTENFKLQKFDELENIVRANPSDNEKGKLYVGDTFDCTKEMYDYLNGGNKLNRSFVEVNYITEEPKMVAEEELIVEEPKEEKKKKTRKKKASKN